MNTAKYLLCALMLGAGAVALAPCDALAATTPKEKNEFPNATRKEPKASVSESGQKKLKAGYDAIDANEPDKAEAALNEVLNAGKSSDYEKAAALVGLANIAWERENADQAIALNQKAIDCIRDGTRINQRTGACLRPVSGYATVTIACDSRQDAGL